VFAEPNQRINRTEAETAISFATTETEIYFGKCLCKEKMGFSQPLLSFSPLFHSISGLLLCFIFLSCSPFDNGVDFYHQSSVSVNLNTGKDLLLFSTGILE